MVQNLPKGKSGQVFIPFLNGTLNDFFRRAKDVLPVKHYRCALVELRQDGAVYQYEKCKWTANGWAGEG